MAVSYEQVMHKGLGTPYYIKLQKGVSFSAFSSLLACP